jgi:hypothetical protein
MGYEYTFVYESDRIAELTERESCVQVAVTVTYETDSASNYDTPLGSSPKQLAVGDVTIVDLYAVDCPLNLMNIKNEDFYFSRELFKQIDRHESELLEHARMVEL